MPGREIKLVNDGIYHIYNRTTDKSKIFKDDSLRFLFLDLLKYYRSIKSIHRYSDYKTLSPDLKEFYDKQITSKKYFLVDLYCFSIMPSHFHLLLRQNREGGISHYISKVINSFTRFFNIKNDRLGSLFLKPFRAVEVRSEEQCKHVHRYIHLNEYSSGLINDINMIFESGNSSLPRYLNNDEDDLVEKDFVLNLFDNNLLRYKKFVLDQADYQKSLERFKYAEKWI